MPELIWPTEILCHEISNIFMQLPKEERVWRKPEPQGLRYSKEDSSGLPGPYGYPYRTCWYDGSIHPEDLYNLLKSGGNVKLGGSDWKYGWPHKFYVDGIPNPLFGKDVIDGSSSGGDLGPKTVYHKGKGPEFTHAKFYNDHLKDFTDDFTFKVFTDILSERTGIRFEKVEDGRLHYRAPYAGFQV